MTESAAKNEYDAMFEERGVAAGPVSHPVAALYGVGSLGTATFVIVPQLYLLFFMTEWLAIPAAWAGLVLLLPKLWEFLFDPAVGAWSDRLDTRWGRRAPPMLVGAALFTVAFAFLFGPPLTGAPLSQAIIIALLYLVCTSAYALYSVPYVTIPAELPGSGPSRVRVIAWRMGFVSIGVLFAGVSAPLLVDRFGGGTGGFAAMGLVLAIVSGASMLMALPAIYRMPRMCGSAASVPLSDQLRAAIANLPFVRLWLAYVIQLVATAISLAALPYFVKYVLRGDEELVTYAFVIFTVTSLLFLPATAWLARRIGQQRAYIAASIVYAAGQLAVLFGAGQDQTALFLTAFALIGIGNAGQQLLPFAMLPRAVDHDRARFGQNREGAFTGFWVAGEKLGLALGGAAAGAILAVGGFVERAADGGSQPHSALIAIVASMTAIPAALFVLSLVPLSGFDAAFEKKRAT